MLFPLCDVEPCIASWTIDTKRHGVSLALISYLWLNTCHVSQKISNLLVHIIIVELRVEGLKLRDNRKSIQHADLPQGGLVTLLLVETTRSSIKLKNCYNWCKLLVHASKIQVVYC